MRWTVHRVGDRGVRQGHMNSNETRIVSLRLRLTLMRNKMGKGAVSGYVQRLTAKAYQQTLRLEFLSKTEREQYHAEQSREHLVELSMLHALLQCVILKKPLLTPMVKRKWRPRLKPCVQPGSLCSHVVSSWF